MIKLISMSILAVIFFSGCGPANYNDTPNAIQRADIMSKNKYGITISHSTWGKKIAFRLADEHCSSFNKVAVYKSTAQQYGPDVISSWDCKE